MDHIPRLVCQAQNHVVILAPVKFGPVQLRPLQQLFIEHAEMTDIVVGTQVVDGVIRLEMHGDHLIHIAVFEGGFVAVDIIRVLFIDHLHIFIQHAGMKQVVVVKRRHEFSRRHFQTSVGVLRDSAVFFKLFVYNPAVLCRVFPADLSHVGMGIVRTVRQAQLPVLIGLCLHGLDHFPQEILRRVPQRRQHADLHHTVKHRIFLAFPLRVVRKAFRTVMTHGFPLVGLVFHFVDDAGKASTVFHPVHLPDAEMHAPAERRAGLPHRIVLDPVQLKLEIIHLILQLGHPARKIGALILLLFVCFPVILIHLSAFHSFCYRPLRVFRRAVTQYLTSIVSAVHWYSFCLEQQSSHRKPI